MVCHPERRRCFANAKHRRSRKPALSAAEGDPFRYFIIYVVEGVSTCTARLGRQGKKPTGKRPRSPYMASPRALDI
jgi:hypothetical protein